MKMGKLSTFALGTTDSNFRFSTLSVWESEARAAQINKQTGRQID